MNVRFTTDSSLDTGKVAIATTISGQQPDDAPQEAASKPESDIDVPAASEPVVDIEPPPLPTAVEPAEVAGEQVEPDTPPPAPADLPPPIVTPAPEPLAVSDAPKPTPARAAIGAIVQRDGTRHPAGNSTLKMGRSTDNDIQIADGQASRHHAEIRYDNGRHHIVDLNSTNGTLVNDNRIASTQALSHGDIITIGNTEFRYESS